MGRGGNISATWFGPQENRTERRHKKPSTPKHTHTERVIQRLTQGQVVSSLLLDKFSGSLGPFRNGRQQPLQGSACS